MRFLLVLAIAILAVLGVAVGCGDDDKLTLEDYFLRLQEVRNDTGERMDALEDPSEGDFDSQEEEIQAYRDFFTAALRNIQDFINGLNEIDPPAEVENLHAEAVDVQTDGMQAIEDIADQLADVQSSSQLEDVFELAAQELAALSEHGAEVCVALQEVADDNAIDVDLECPEDETASAPPILPSPRPAEIPREGNLLGIADAPVTVVVFCDFQ